jgi:hypothetical protein
MMSAANLALEIINRSSSNDVGATRGEQSEDADGWMGCVLCGRSILYGITHLRAPLVVVMGHQR